jgi:CHAT domain-containing protein/tetratricopeptide (TPR) repeat protein
MLVAIVLAALATGQLTAAPDGGVVVTAVDRALLDDVDLRPGDVLLSWAQENPEAGAPLEGTIDSPFDLGVVETLRCPRGPVVLRGARGDEVFEALVEPEWCAFRNAVEPRLGPDQREAYRRGDAHLRAGRASEGIAEWSAVADGLPASSATRCWLLARVAAEQIKAKSMEEGQSTFERAVSCAEAVAPASVPLVVEHEGHALRDAGAPAEAVRAFERALVLQSRPGVDPLARVPILVGLNDTGAPLSSLSPADPLGEAIAIASRHAPESPLLVRALTSLLAFRHSSDPRSGFELMARLEAIFASRGSDYPAGLRARNAMAQFLAIQGRSQEGEQLARQVVQWYRSRGSATEEAAAAEINLAALLGKRGDLEGKDEHLRHAAFLLEKGGGRPRIRAVVMNNRAELMRDRGHLAAALALHASAVATLEQHVPGSYMHAAALGSQASAWSASGDTRAARAAFERALAIAERGDPRSPFVAETVLQLAKLERSEGRPAAAETLYRRALAMLEEKGIEQTPQAEAWNGLAASRRALGDPAEALSCSTKAVALMERLRDGIGSSPEARALFTAHFHDIYRDHVLLLVEQGRTAEAFETLERGRARSLLALMAERDLRLRDGLPAELEQERRAAHAAYDRAQAALAGLTASASADEAEQKRVALGQARSRVSEIADTVRRTAPRAAEARYPDAFSTARIASALEPGVVLVSYAVGSEETVAIALKPGPPAGDPVLRAVVIPLGARALRERVAAFRTAAERTVPPRSFGDDARSLYDVLLAPLAPQLLGARRLLVSADGPLHGLPFAALRTPRGLLVERVALQSVFSGTVYAEVAARRRRVSGTPRLVAFGDPSGPDLALPAARREVGILASLFPRGTVYVGAEATEGRAKGLGTNADYVHFAGHAVVDEHSPLDSSLLLAAGDPQDNGRLQAWEIIESVRLDADLVTLSACRGAAGSEQAGEGIIGLTRAFHFAGARTVVASLWDAGDRSSARFMERFYRALRAGTPKADALRAAQVEAIRAGEHPLRWAGFQSYGDWR